MITARRVLVCTLLLWGVLAVAGGAMADGPPTMDTSQEGMGAPDGHALAVQEGGDGNESANDTPRHRNPDEYGEDGDLGAVESWLEGYLASQLGDSAIQLSEGEYDRAKTYVGPEYRERLDQFVDVAGDTDGGDADERASAFEQARSNQERLADATDEYRETREAYDQARQEGNDERARELARELESLAGTIGESSAQVQDHYETIEAGTDADLGDAETAIRDVNQTIQAEQAEIRAAEFQETALTLTVADETISFREPLTATGRLRTADGEPVADEEIRLVVGNRTSQVTTNASGAFPFEYRPTSLPLNTTSLTVEYVPTNQSVYLGTTTTVPVSVEQAEPTLTLAETPETVAYGDAARVTGVLVVGDTPVDDVPLEVRLGDHRVGTVRTNRGGFIGSVDIPAGVAAGDRPLTVSLPYTDQALAGTNASAPVTVTETATNLSIDARSGGEGAVTVNGTLTTTAGEGVAGQAVDVRVDGTTVATATTAADGTLASTVPLPASATDDVRIVAVYDGQGTNLARAEATAMVSLGGTTGDGSPGPAGLPAWVWLAIGLALVLSIAAGLRWNRARDEGAVEPVAADSDESDPSGGAAESTTNSAGIRSVLDRAGEELANGRADAAVQTGYAAVRQTLGETLEDATTLTHWEFYRHYRTAEESESGTPATKDDNPLRTVTAGYERAAFGPDGIAADEAAAVLERAHALCGLDETESPSPPADD